jgi:hypothetical protein
MDSSHFKVAGIGLLIGAVLAAAGAATLGVGIVLRNLAPPSTPPSNPNDSPVTARGGSIVLHSYVAGQFSASSKTTQMVNLGTAASPIVLDGVAPGGTVTTPPETVTLTTSSNWKLVMTFRGKDHGEKSTTNLTFCTHVDASGNCSLDALATSTQLYVQSSVDGSGNPYGSFTPVKIDTPGLRFDMNTCDDGSTDVKESACNHPFALYFYQGSDTKPSQTFQCLDGQCVIGIGTYPGTAKP